MSLTLEGMAPPASLRIDKPVWGVDPGSAEMAFASLQPQLVAGELTVPELDWHTVKLMTGGPPHIRWVRAANGLHAAVAELKRQWGGAPALVCIEQPFSTGHQTEASSYYAIALLLAALGQLGLETDVQFLPPQTWKSVATGHGYGPGLKAIKDRTARYKAEKRRLVEWAQSAGYDGKRSNEADAIGVATAAGVILEKRRAGAWSA